MTMKLSNVALTQEGMTAEVLDDERVRFAFINEDSGGDMGGIDTSMPEPPAVAPE